MRGKALEQVMAALKQLGGYFVLRDDDGEQYVVMPKKEFDSMQHNSTEVQLSLPAAPVPSPIVNQDISARDVLEKMNRELAVYQAGLEDEMVEDTAIESGLSSENVGFEQPTSGVDSTAPPFAKATEGESADKSEGLRVRFEPLHGDLPPELQE